MASRDFDKFVGFATKNILQNWGRLVADNIKNDLEGKKPPKEIPMIDALENIGIELTLEEKEYFKDKVLTHVDIIPDVPFTDMPDNKATITVNYVEYNCNYYRQQDGGCRATRECEWEGCYGDRSKCPHKINMLYKEE